MFEESLTEPTTLYIAPALGVEALTTGVWSAAACCRFVFSAYDTRDAYRLSRRSPPNKCLTLSITPGKLGEAKAAASCRTPNMRDWPHSPLHRLGEPGAYIVTAGTYLKRKRSSVAACGWNSCATRFLTWRKSINGLFKRGPYSPITTISWRCPRKKRLHSRLSRSICIQSRPSRPIDGRGQQETRFGFSSEIPH